MFEIGKFLKQFYNTGFSILLKKKKKSENIQYSERKKIKCKTKIKFNLKKKTQSIKAASEEQFLIFTFSDIDK